ncbi:MAG: hypothetical protein VYC34_08610, partial [Planctomycetota bacterium]|nr:hypothetical protein [Planctomycetota bacterium]
INSAIAAYYYLKLAAFPLLEKRDDLEDAPTLNPAVWRRVAALSSAVGVIALALFITPIQRSVKQAATIVPPPTIRVESEDPAIDATPERSEQISARGH